MKQLTITVTQDDIDMGVMGDSCQCPIALATQRLLLDADVVTVGHVTVGATAIYDGLSDDGEYSDVYMLPYGAQIFIQDFDRGNMVEPFTFVTSPLEHP